MNPAPPTIIQYAGDDFLSLELPAATRWPSTFNGERKTAPGPLDLFIAGWVGCTASDVISIFQLRSVSSHRLSRSKFAPKSGKNIAVFPAVLTETYRPWIQYFRRKRLKRAKGFPPRVLHCDCHGAGTAEIVTSYEIQAEQANPGTEGYY